MGESSPAAGGVSGGWYVYEYLANIIKLGENPYFYKYEVFLIEYVVKLGDILPILSILRTLHNRYICYILPRLPILTLHKNNYRNHAHAHAYTHACDYMIFCTTRLVHFTHVPCF